MSYRRSLIHKVKKNGGAWRESGEGGGLGKVLYDVLLVYQWYCSASSAEQGALTCFVLIASCRMLSDLIKAAELNQVVWLW